MFVHHLDTIKFYSFFKTYSKCYPYPASNPKGLISPFNFNHTQEVSGVYMSTFLYYTATSLRVVCLFTLMYHAEHLTLNIQQASNEHQLDE